MTDVLEGHEEADVMILPSWTFFTTSLAGDERVGGASYAQHFWSTTAERWGHEHATPYPRPGAPLSRGIE